MKLIEKKCPNCGASLEFGDNDKSCKCTYCHRAFEIERDKSIESDDISEQFNLTAYKEKIKKAKEIFESDEYKETLKEAQKLSNEMLSDMEPFGFKIIKWFLITIFFVGFISFFVLTGSRVYKSTKENYIKKYSEVNKSNDNTDLIENTDELTNRQIEKINDEARGEIPTHGKGENSIKHSYLRETPEREKLYVAYKENNNVLVVVFKTVFYDFYHKEDRHTIYIPVVYNNVDKELKELVNAKIDASEYFFNDDNSCYYYGYSTFEEVYTYVIEPLKKEYKISEY